MMNKRLVLFALFLTALVVYTRVRYHAPYLYSWDSVSFALSLENYDIKLHQPHPPGYFLYSYTLKFLNLLFRDPNITMLFLNIISTIGACILITLTVFEIAGKTGKAFVLGLGAALIYATNPISWFYGCVAEIYAVEGFFSALIMYLLLSSNRSRLNIVYAGIAMGLAGGFRPTTEVFLLPFYLFHLFRKDRVLVVTSVLALLVVNAAWFLPLVNHAGGLDEYFEIVRNLTAKNVNQASPLINPGEDHLAARKIPIRLIQSITIPVLLGVLLKLQRIRLTTSEISLAVLMLPSLIFFFLIHYAKDGYLLVVIPAILVLFVTILSKLYQNAVALSLILSLSIFFNCFLFLQPSARRDQSNKWLSLVFSAPNQNVIRKRVDHLSQFFRAFEKLNETKRIFVLEERHYFPNWRTMCWYLPNDKIVLSRTKWRVFYAESHTYKVIDTPVKIPAESWIIAVGRTPPKIEMSSYTIEGFTYYYASALTLPRRFVLYSTPFSVLKEKQSGTGDD